MFSPSPPVPSPIAAALHNKASVSSFTSHLRRLAHKVTFRNLRAERRAQEQEELEDDRGAREIRLALTKLKSVHDFDDMIKNGFLVDVKTGYREPTVRFSLTPILARDGVLP